jgi:CheY-like chemotaxis protein
MRLLVVEDESLISILIEETLLQLGHEIVGPAVRLGQAVGLARSAPVDAAILDINVHGEAIYPAAAILADRGIPMLLVTGYNIAEIDEPFRSRPVLRKPFTSDGLAQALDRMMARP